MCSSQMSGKTSILHVETICILADVVFGTTKLEWSSAVDWGSGFTVLLKPCITDRNCPALIASAITGDVLKKRVRIKTDCLPQIIDPSENVKVFCNHTHNRIENNSSTRYKSRSRVDAHNHSQTSVCQPVRLQCYSHRCTWVAPDDWYIHIVHLHNICYELDTPSLFFLSFNNVFHSHSIISRSRSSRSDSLSSLSCFSPEFNSTQTLSSCVLTHSYKENICRDVWQLSSTRWSRRCYRAQSSYH